MPYNPNGWGVDYLRSCYETSCRFFSDSAIEVRILWYKCAAGAPVIAGHNLIGSGNWSDHSHRWQVIGEVEGASRAWRDGSRPWNAAIGQPAGNPAYFKAAPPFSAAGEMPVTSFGAPVSCNPWLAIMGDINTYTHVGDANWSSYYPAGLPTPEIGPAAIGDSNQLVALPLVRPVTRFVDRVAVFQTGPQALPQKVRIGIYASTSGDDLYPSELIAESDEIVLPQSNANEWRYHDFDPPIELEEGRLYWVATVRNGGTAYLYSSDFLTSFFAVLGWIQVGATSAAAAVALKVPYTFGSLPDPFPAYPGDSVFVTGQAYTVPFVRYSS